MNDLRNIHPAGARLDAVVTGDADGDAREHVASCTECAAYVARLRGEVEAFAAAPRPETSVFVAAVTRRRAAEVERRRRGRWLGATSSALALAAGVLLVVRALPSPTAPVDPPVGTAAEGPIRFKGGSQVAIVVDRRGVQSRETGTLHVAAGDRIRVEIALDHEDDVQAGVLADDGSWVELQPAGRLGAGTHFSANAVAFDEHVDEGWILVGSPGAVAKARATRDLSAVHAIRIHLSPP